MSIGSPSPKRIVTPARFTAKSSRIVALRGTSWRGETRRSWARASLISGSRLWRTFTDSFSANFADLPSASRRRTVHCLESDTSMEALHRRGSSSETRRERTSPPSSTSSTVCKDLLTRRFQVSSVPSGTVTRRVSSIVFGFWFA